MKIVKFKELNIGQNFFVYYKKGRVKFSKTSGSGATVLNNNYLHLVGDRVYFLQNDEVEVDDPEITVEEIKHGYKGFYLIRGKTSNGELMVAIAKNKEGGVNHVKERISEINKELNPPSKHDELEQLIEDGNVMDALMLMAQILKEK